MGSVYVALITCPHGGRVENINKMHFLPFSLALLFLLLFAAKIDEKSPSKGSTTVHIQNISEILNKSTCLFNKRSSGLHFVYPVCSTHFPGCKNILYVSDCPIYLVIFVFVCRTRPERPKPFTYCDGLTIASISLFLEW